MIGLTVQLVLIALSAAGPLYLAHRLRTAPPEQRRLLGRFLRNRPAMAVGTLVAAACMATAIAGGYAAGGVVGALSLGAVAAALVDRLRPVPRA